MAYYLFSIVFIFFFWKKAICLLWTDNLCDGCEANGVVNTNQSFHECRPGRSSLIVSGFICIILPCPRRTELKNTTRRHFPQPPSFCPSLIFFVYFFFRFFCSRLFFLSSIFRYFFFLFTKLNLFSVFGSGNCGITNTSNSSSPLCGLESKFRIKIFLGFSVCFFFLFLLGKMDPVPSNE